MNDVCGGLLWRAPPDSFRLAMPNGTIVYLMGMTDIPVTLVGQTHKVEACIVKYLPIDLLLGLPALSAMGAVIDTADMCIRLKAVPHRALKIRLDGEAPREVYTVERDTVLPLASQSVVSVLAGPLGENACPEEGEWRTITPYEPTVRYKQLMVANGVIKDQRRKW